MIVPCYNRPVYLMAQPEIIGCFRLTLLEKDAHDLGHIDAHEHIWVRNHGCHEGQHGRFRDRVVLEVLPAQQGHKKVPFNDKSAIETLGAFEEITKSTTLVAEQSKLYIELETKRTS